MGLTEEKIKIELKYSEEYTYKGKELGNNEIESIKENIEERVKQSVYNVLEDEMWTLEGEDLDYKNMEFEIKVSLK